MTISSKSLKFYVLLVFHFSLFTSWFFLFKVLIVATNIMALFVMPTILIYFFSSFLPPLPLPAIFPKKIIAIIADFKIFRTFG